MLILMFVFWLLVVSAFFVLVGYGMLVGIQNLAKRNKFFTSVPRPGTFAFVVAGENEVVKILENVVGWETNEDQLFVLSDPKKDKMEKFNWTDYWLAKQLGVAWIGPFKTIKKIDKWKWSEFKQAAGKDGKPKYEVILRDAKESEEKGMNNFFFQFPYPVVLSGVELSGNIQANGLIVFTILHLNPKRAVFLNKDPVDLFTAMASSAVRAWMSTKEFDKLKEVTVLSDNNAPDAEDFWKMLNDLNGLKINEDSNLEINGEKIPKGQPLYDQVELRGLYGKLGMIIVRAELVQFDIEEGEASKAIEANKIAALKGQAKITEAEKDAEAVVAKAKGAAMAMDAEREARAQWVRETIVGPTGGSGTHVADVLVAEQIAGSNVTTYVAGSRSKAPKALIAVPPSGGKGKKSES